MSPLPAQVSPTPALPRRVSLRAVAGLLIALLLSLLSLDASAQARAWLDRDVIGAGETVTLNIHATAADAPDYGPLQQDFSVSGHTSRREFELVNGKASSRTLYAVALRPRREGVLTIPALDVGGQRTQPMSLVVTPGQAQIPSRAGDEVFIESQADDQDPYVQQAVGWVVRLYSAVPLVSGQLDQPAPQGASLRQVGDDAQYSRQIQGRRYQVIERRFLLIPERSGSLTIPSATFEGRGVAGFFDDFLGGGRSALQARAPPRFLQVRPAPANAPQPWLPLHDLRVRYQSTPQELWVGSAATLTIEVTADGATAAQMPELQLPPIDGVQVFAEPVQADESFVDGRPQVTLTRAFSLVAARAGEVKLSGMRLGWWDVDAGAARTATLPALGWQVSAADGTQAAAPAASVSGPGSTVAEAPAWAARGSAQPWVLAAVLFAALWLITLLWALQRRAQPAAGRSSPADAVTAPAAKPDTASLKRALDTGDFSEVAEALCALARPRAHDLDEVRASLDDPLQREALDAMQRARWGDGDGVAARAQLRAAFARGPRWRAQVAARPAPLPPLYPPG